MFHIVSGLGCCVMGTAGGTPQISRGDTLENIKRME